MIEFIKDNISWLKDIFTLLFTGTATILTVLTYRRARATILQPKRTEVIKLQTQILTDFLAIILENNNSIDNCLDYTKIFIYNIDLALREFSLADIVKLDNKHQEYLENVGGYIQFSETNPEDYFYVKGDIESYYQIFPEKSGNPPAIADNIIISKIVLTNKHFNFFEKLKALNTNPFLPKDIQEVANQIGNNIKVNLHCNLRVIIQKLIQEITTSYNDDSSDKYELFSEEFRYKSLYQVFELERNKHDKDFELLTTRIRKHLMIDEKW